MCAPARRNSLTSFAQYKWPFITVIKYRIRPAAQAPKKSVPRQLSREPSLTLKDFIALRPIVEKMWPRGSNFTPPVKRTLTHWEILRSRGRRSNNAVVAIWTRKLNSVNGMENAWKRFKELLLMVFKALTDWLSVWRRARVNKASQPSSSV